ncbi:MAG: ACT domain-containing protein, partial [Actinobacteria bacterium]|nr:ACT domain-containing protein [Actinomycetota bacterium]
MTGTTIVSILAQDRSGLLADCAGVLAALDLSVLEARAFTTSDGMALDWFTVTGDVDPPAAGALLRAALDGSVDVGERLTRPRWRGPAIPWAPHRGASPRRTRSGTAACAARRPHRRRRRGARRSSRRASRWRRLRPPRAPPPAVPSARTPAAPRPAPSSAGA